MDDLISFDRYKTRNLQMNYKEQSDKLAGPIGLLKQCVYCSVIRAVNINCFRYVSRCGRETAEGTPNSEFYEYAPIDFPLVDATQIFGGRALTTTGMGKFIENVGIHFPYVNSLSLFKSFKQYHRTSGFDASEHSIWIVTDSTLFNKLFQYWQEQRMFLETWEFDKH